MPFNVLFNNEVEDLSGRIRVYMRREINWGDPQPNDKPADEILADLDSFDGQLLMLQEQVDRFAPWLKWELDSLQKIVSTLRSKALSGQPRSL